MTDASKSERESNPQPSNEEKKRGGPSGADSSQAPLGSEPNTQAKADDVFSKITKTIQAALNFDTPLDEGSSVQFRDVFIVQSATNSKFGGTYNNPPDSAQSQKVDKSDYERVFEISLALLNGFKKTQVMSLYEYLSDIWLYQRNVNEPASTTLGGNPLWVDEEKLIQAVGAVGGTAKKRFYGGQVRVETIQFEDSSKARHILDNLPKRLVRDLPKIIETSDFDVKKRLATVIGIIGKNDLQDLVETVIYPWATSESKLKRVLAGYCLLGVMEEATLCQSVHAVLDNWARGSDAGLKWTAAFASGIIGVQHFDDVADVLEHLLEERGEDLKLVTVRSWFYLAFAGSFQQVIHSLAEGARWSPELETQTKTEKRSVMPDSPLREIVDLHLRKQAKQERLLGTLVAFAVIGEQLSPQDDIQSNDEEDDDLNNARMRIWNEIATAAEQREPHSLIQVIADLFQIGFKWGYISGVNLFLSDLIRSWIDNMQESRNTKIGVLAIMKRIYNISNDQEQLQWKKRLNNWTTKSKDHKPSFEAVNAEMI